ncbi:hypothetical protein BpHYR1_021298 [Brachionus plicatilis]|uniref:Uncharacterized protein n=1 Tax=Brachionus plicatilis TaxID=10195 RepID=A0A3M7SDT5_BRAPC|nr:hypothetical protein BpHYR1_021298 [Brachionus plicatilis]
MNILAGPRSSAAWNCSTIDFWSNNSESRLVAESLFRYLALSLDVIFARVVMRWSCGSRK